MNESALNTGVLGGGANSPAIRIAGNGNVALQGSVSTVLTCYVPTTGLIGMVGSSRQQATLSAQASATLGCYGVVWPKVRWYLAPAGVIALGAQLVPTRLSIVGAAGAAQIRLSGSALAQEESLRRGPRTLVVPARAAVIPVPDDPGRTFREQ